MTNTINFNDEKMQEKAVQAMRYLIAENGEEKTMNELFELISQYEKISREKFLELYNQAKEKIASWENNTSLCRELDEDELDMVAGGGVGDWISEHKVGLGILASVLVCGGLGALAGGTFMVSLIGLSTAGSAALGGFFGGVLGLGLGIVFTLGEPGDTCTKKL